MTVAHITTVLVLSCVFSLGVTTLAHGIRYYRRGAEDARRGLPLFVSHDPNDPFWVRTFFLFWDWCERKGYEQGG